MARLSKHQHLSSILDAAEQWKCSCLLADRSVFSGTQLWSPVNLQIMGQQFGRDFSSAGGDPVQRIQAALSPTPAAVRQLAAEMLWLLLLFPSELSAANKRQVVVKTWSLSGSEMESAHRLLNALDYGVGPAGGVFGAQLDQEFSSLVGVMDRWKQQTLARQHFLAGNAWALGNWIDCAC